MLAISVRLARDVRHPSNAPVSTVKKSGMEAGESGLVVLKQTF